MEVGGVVGLVDNGTVAFAYLPLALFNRARGIDLPDVVVVRDGVAGEC